MATLLALLPCLTALGSIVTAFIGHRTAVLALNNTPDMKQADAARKVQKLKDAKNEAISTNDNDATKNGLA